LIIFKQYRLAILQTVFSVQITFRLTLLLTLISLLGTILRCLYSFADPDRGSGAF
jgi:hypothetical protein